MSMASRPPSGSARPPIRVADIAAMMRSSRWDSDRNMNRRECTCEESLCGAVMKMQWLANGRFQHFGDVRQGTREPLALRPATPLYL